MRNDNYPDDIRQYDDHPDSPFYDTGREVHCYNCDWEGYEKECEVEVDYDEEYGTPIPYHTCPDCGQGTLEFM